MNGLKMSSTTLNATFQKTLAAIKSPLAHGDFVWDCHDEDERPLGKDEMLAGITVARKRRGRPAGSCTKVQVIIRLDHDVLTAFRTDGPGWQTRMNEALKDWLGRIRRFEWLGLSSARALLFLYLIEHLSISQMA